MIASSELIINADGSVFHLHLRPEELADTVILVGDPARSDLVASYFDEVTVSRSNREFRSHTGIRNGRPVSVISTGIGCDNIDIVVTELDALVNVDFATRTVKEEKRQLTLLRLGTSGAVQDDLRIGDYVMSAVSVGCDGLLNFYAGATDVSDLDMEQAFVEQTGWGERLARPYCVVNDEWLIDKFKDIAIKGVTATASGFYGPQGRVVRLELAKKDLLEKIENFRYKGLRITNFEMESSAIAALSALLGHRALTICTIIAQRTQGDSQTDYEEIMRKLIKKALEKLTE